MPLGIDRESQAGRGDGALFADAGEHVEKGPALRHVIKNIVDGNQRRPALRAKLGQKAEPARFVAAMIMHAGKEGAAGRGAGESGKAGGKVVHPPPRSGGGCIGGLRPPSIENTPMRSLGCGAAWWRGRCLLIAFMIAPFTALRAVPLPRSATLPGEG